ncbi:MAG: PAS domain-containing protein [Chloroflexi bacterium]|nr:PAS domain-containing protein [Chloroflexota bacterium]MDA1004178.1 PAS domain-containing protein [Chloroflexota bacterium]
MSDHDPSRRQGATGAGNRLAERIRELEVTISSLADLVIVVDADGRVVECNGASGRVWGLTPTQVIGQPMPTSSGRLEVMDRQGHIIAPDAVPTARALKTGRSQRVPVLGIRRGDGGVTWAQVVAVPVSA